MGSFLYFYFWDHHGASPLDVLSRPADFDSSTLPMFFSFCLACCGGGGGPSVRHDSLSIGFSSALTISQASAISTKSAYSYLMSENLSTPHCVIKFAPIFGFLYWSCTWRQLFLFDMDRPVIDLAWKIAHGVLNTADHLSFFGYSLQLSCFCNSAPETIDHLFFECPLAQSALSWLQSLMFHWSLVAPCLVVRHVRFDFNVDEFSNIPRVFIDILNVCKFLLWQAQNNFSFDNNCRPVVAFLSLSLLCHLLFLGHYHFLPRHPSFVLPWYCFLCHLCRIVICKGGGVHCPGDFDVHAAPFLRHVIYCCEYEMGWLNIALCCVHPPRNKKKVSFWTVTLGGASGDCGTSCIYNLCYLDQLW